MIARRSTPTSSGSPSCAAWWPRSTRAGSSCCRRTCCSSSACRRPSRPGTSEPRCAARWSSASAVSAGFVAVFLVVGVVTETIDSWLLSNAKYATVVIGVGVRGPRRRHARRLPAALRHAAPRRRRPHTQRRVDVRVRHRLRRGVARLHDAAVPHRPCSAPAAARGSPPASPTRCSTAPGWGSSSIALTVSLAGANQLLLGALRSAMRYVDLIAAAFLVLSGVYLLYYFAVVDVGERHELDHRLGAAVPDPRDHHSGRPLGAHRRRARRRRRRRPRVRRPAGRGPAPAPSGDDGAGVTDEVPLRPAATVMLRA